MSEFFPKAMAQSIASRVVLRPLTLELSRSITAGVPSGQEWAEGYPTEGDVVIASIALEAGDAHDATTPWGPFQVCLADEVNTAIGGVGAIHPPDASGEVEIGYGIAESARGQGLALEAVQLFMRSVLAHGVRTFIAVISPENHDSQRLAERAGFTFERMISTEHDGDMQRWVHSVR
jgi:RimJ/RimL family protein N-acetyltransferase